VTNLGSASFLLPSSFCIYSSLSNFALSFFSLFLFSTHLSHVPFFVTNLNMLIPDDNVYLLLYTFDIFTYLHHWSPIYSVLIYFPMLRVLAKRTEVRSGFSTLKYCNHHEDASLFLLSPG
jgi:hypothetical protein